MVLNAANEVSVDAFLSKKIRFTGISKIIDAIMNVHNIIHDPDLETILDADAWARQEAQKQVAAHPDIN